MKNIIFLSFLDTWSMGEGKGAPSFYKTIEAYKKEGWNVVLITPKYKSGYIPNFKGVKIITFKPIFFSLTKLRKIGFFGRILHSMQGNYMLYKLCKKALSDFRGEALVYAYEVNGVKAGYKLKEEFGLPFVTRFQGTILTNVKDTLINRLRKYPHFQALETKADLLIMTDDGTQGNKVLDKLNNQSSEIKFWKNGVDIDLESEDNKMISKKHLGLAPSDRVLMTVSRLASWKKVDRAIKALSVVIKQNKNVKLVIVGDGDEKHNLLSLTEKLGLASNVIFAGAVPQSEIRHYLDLADVFLSLYDLSNVGNPLLEAMTCGKPIITLNVGDTASIIKNGENGILLDLNELEMIPKYIIKLLNEPKLAKKLGDNAKDYARKNFWSWDERMQCEVKIVSDLYEKWVLNKNNL